MPKLHVGAISGKGGGYSDVLKEGASRYGLKLTFLGAAMDEREASRSVRAYLKSLPDRDLFMLVGAEDTIVMKPESEIVSRFGETELPILVSVNSATGLSRRYLEWKHGVCRDDVVDGMTYMGTVNKLGEMLERLERLRLQPKRDNTAGLAALANYDLAWWDAHVEHDRHSRVFFTPHAEFASQYGLWIAGISQRPRMESFPLDRGCVVRGSGSLDLTPIVRALGFRQPVATKRSETVAELL